MKNESQNASALLQSRTRSILSWILAVLLFLIGLGLLGSNVFIGLLMIAVAASFVPALKIKLRQRIKRPGIVQGISIFVLLIAAAATMPSTPTTEQNAADTSATEQSVTDTSAQNEQTSGSDVSQPENAEVTSDSNVVVSPEQDTTNIDSNADTNDVVVEPAPAQEVTVSQKNAVQKAKSYLAYTAFSYSGLISQLEYEGYSNADATYGADNSGADWYEQAAKKAEDYMNYSAFSRSGLISQLEYDGFTRSQAEHGADAVGL